MPADAASDTGALLEAGWRQYRGWVESSYKLKASMQLQAFWALGLTGSTGLLGALAALPDSVHGIRQYAAFGAGVTAACAGVFSTHIFDPKTQEKFVAARAAGEAIKSECYRYATLSGDYAGPDAGEHFVKHLEECARQALAAGSLADAVAAAGKLKREPPRYGLTARDYCTVRLEDQLRWFSEKTGQHASKAKRARLATGIIAAAGAALAFLAGSLQDDGRWIAPFVGMVTAFSGAVAAYGAADRNQFLALSYAGMARQIGILVGRHKSGQLAEGELVTTGEDLLTAEHRAWAQELLREGPARDRSGDKSSKKLDLPQSDSPPHGNSG